MKMTETMERDDEATAVEGTEAANDELRRSGETPLEAPEVSQHVARVLDSSSQGHGVLLAGARLTARKARSCLIEPRASDLVLIARNGRKANATAWILAVLDRPEADATLSFEGDVTVKSRGKVTLAAAEGMDLLTRRKLKVASDEVSVTAHRAEAMVERASWIGQVFNSRLDTIKTVAGVIDRVATRVSERARRVYRTTEEAEYWRAGQIDVKVDDALTTHSKNTVMSSDHLMKLNGDQIHLG